MEYLKKEFVRNLMGIKIVKCCSSCAYHGAGIPCSIDGVNHPRGFCCNNWIMRDGLANAGRGGGKVKKKGYLDFINRNGLHHAWEYERMYGSKYLTKK